MGAMRYPHANQPPDEGGDRHPGRNAFPKAKR